MSSKRQWIHVTSPSETLPFDVENTYDKIPSSILESTLLYRLKERIMDLTLVPRWRPAAHSLLEKNDLTIEDVTEAKNSLEEICSCLNSPSLTLAPSEVCDHLYFCGEAYRRLAQLDPSKKIELMAEARIKWELAANWNQAPKDSTWRPLLRLGEFYSESEILAGKLLAINHFNGVLNGWETLDSKLAPSSEMISIKLKLGQTYAAAYLQIQTTADPSPWIDHRNYNIEAIKQFLDIIEHKQSSYKDRQLALSGLGKVFEVFDNMENLGEDVAKRLPSRIISSIINYGCPSTDSVIKWGKNAAEYLNAMDIDLPENNNPNYESFSYACLRAISVSDNPYQEARKNAVTALGTIHLKSAKQQIPVERFSSTKNDINPKVKKEIIASIHQSKDSSHITEAHQYALKLLQNNPYASKAKNSEIEIIEAHIEKLKKVDPLDTRGALKGTRQNFKSDYMEYGIRLLSELAPIHGDSAYFMGMIYQQPLPLSNEDTKPATNTAEFDRAINAVRRYNQSQGIEWLLNDKILQLHDLGYICDDHIRSWSCTAQNLIFAVEKGHTEAKQSLTELVTKFVDSCPDIRFSDYPKNVLFKIGNLWLEKKIYFLSKNSEYFLKYLVGEKHAKAATRLGGRCLEQENYDGAAQYLVLAAKNCNESMEKQRAKIQGEKEDPLIYHISGPLNCVTLEPYVDTINHESLFELSQLYFEGTILEKNTKKAQTLLKKAAQKGNQQAIDALEEQNAEKDAALQSSKKENFKEKPSSTASRKARVSSAIDLYSV